MEIRAFEIENRKWFRIEVEKPTSIILGSFVSKNESLKYINDLVEKLKKLGWDCSYDKDAELLVCKPVM